MDFNLCLQVSTFILSLRAFRVGEEVFLLFLSYEQRYENALVSSGESSAYRIRKRCGNADDQGRPRSDLAISRYRHLRCLRMQQNTNELMPVGAKRSRRLTAWVFQNTSGIATFVAGRTFWGRDFRQAGDRFTATAV